MPNVNVSNDFYQKFAKYTEFSSNEERPGFPIFSAFLHEHLVSEGSNQPPQVKNFGEEHHKAIWFSLSSYIPQITQLKNNKQVVTKIGANVVNPISLQHWVATVSSFEPTIYKTYLLENTISIISLLEQTLNADTISSILKNSACFAENLDIFSQIQAHLKRLADEKNYLNPNQIAQIGLSLQHVPLNLKIGEALGNLLGAINQHLEKASKDKSNKDTFQLTLQGMLPGLAHLEKMEKAPASEKMYKQIAKSMKYIKSAADSPRTRPRSNSDVVPKKYSINSSPRQQYGAEPLAETSSATTLISPRKNSTSSSPGQRVRFEETPQNPTRYGAVSPRKISTGTSPEPRPRNEQPTATSSGAGTTDTASPIYVQKNSTDSAPRLGARVKELTLQFDKPAEKNLQPNQIHATSSKPELSASAPIFLKKK